MKLNQKQRQSRREIFQLADSFRWISKTERIREDCHVLLAGEDGSTQKRGEFGMLVLILIFLIFFMFEPLRVGNYGLYVFKSGNKLRKQPEPLMLVIFLYLRIPQFTKLNLQ